MAAGEARRVQRPALRDRAQAERMVLAILQAEAESLLSVARRHSLCLDDAHDAYQRAVEIFLRHAPTLDEDRAAKWVHTVVKHEAMRLRTARLRIVGSEEHDLDAHEASDLPAPEEQALRFERLTRSAEALQRLKPHELRALWLRAQGHSYQEIAELCDWSRTKVNRCVTEGRRSFLERYAGIESGAECRRWEGVLSAMVDGEATPAQLAELRPHLRNCRGCRATLRALHESDGGLAALLPAPAALAAAADPARHAEATGGLLARLHDALLGPIQERASASAIKLQAGVEAVASGKVAAVAASAAALAGGGVAVERATSDPPRAPAARQAEALAGAAVRAAGNAVAPPGARGADQAAWARRGAGGSRRARATRRSEFGLDGSGGSARSAAASTAAREFGSPGAATSASSQPAAPTSSQTPAGSSAAVRTAAREFGG